MREICHVYTYLFIFLRQLYPVHYFPLILFYSTFSSSELVYNSIFERSFICRSIAAIFTISLHRLSFSFLWRSTSCDFLSYYWQFINSFTLRWEHIFYIYLSISHTIIPLSLISPPPLYFSFKFFHFISFIFFIFIVLFIFVIPG